MCPHEEKMTAWLLGDLPPEEQREMTRHLESCAECRAARAALSRIIAPLRSGLEKDKRIGVPGPVAAPVTPQMRWRPRQAWLRRAALFAASFGTLFAFINIVYRQAGVGRRDEGTVTHITFRKEEPPAPSLAPVPAPQAPDKEEISLLEGSPSAALTPPAAPAVIPPAAPAAEPKMPAFRRLVAADVHGEADRERTPAPSAETARSPAAAAAEAKALAKGVDARNRTQDAPPKKRPSGDLFSKPIQLAGAVAAATNACSTNAVPTNAVSPNASSKKP